MAETKKRTYTKKTENAKKSESAETEKKTAAEEAAENPEEKALYSENEVQAMIAKAVAAAMENMKAQQTPQIIQVAADTEKVQFLFQAEVSDENVFEIGPQGMYGRVVGKTGSFFVPKADLSRAMDSMFRLLLAKRWIIAVDGLTDEERDAYGVDYKEGELLDKRAFARMVELGSGILDIYPKLCEGHREMVAKRYHEAYASKSPYVTREIVVELNRLSRELGSEKGDFTDIIESMNAADLG